MMMLLNDGKRGRRRKTYLLLVWLVFKERLLCTVAHVRLKMMTSTSGLLLLDVVEMDTSSSHQINSKEFRQGSRQISLCNLVHFQAKPRAGKCALWTDEWWRIFSRLFISPRLGPVSKGIISLKKLSSRSLPDFTADFACFCSIWILIFELWAGKKLKSAWRQILNNDHLVGSSWDLRRRLDSRCPVVSLLRLLRQQQAVNKNMLTTDPPRFVLEANSGLACKTLPSNPNKVAKYSAKSDNWQPKKTTSARRKNYSFIISSFCPWPCCTSKSTTNWSFRSSHFGGHPWWN